MNMCLGEVDDFKSCYRIKNLFVLHRLVESLYP